MLVLEATTIRLCEMNCYPIPHLGYIPRENTTSGPAGPTLHVLVNWKEKAGGEYGRVMVAMNVRSDCGIL